MARRCYPRYTAEVNDLLDFARIVRKIAARYPDYICAGDLLQHLDRFGSHQWWDLMEIVLDHEERSTTKVRRHSR